MLVSFNFLFNLVKFDMRIDYLADNLDFQNTLDDNNIAKIENRYKSIDNIQTVHLTGQNVLRIKYLDRYKRGIIPDPILVRDPDGKMFAPSQVKFIELKLNATIYLHKDGGFIIWYTTGDVPFWFNETLEIHYAAIKPVLMGTAIHKLPAMKEAAKAVVAENAAKRAWVMMNNAEAILKFLGVYTYG